jgi:phosphoribosylaminoimidazolecarboxamide formyltransferase / IMP cyclohydrolase
MKRGTDISAFKRVYRTRNVGDCSTKLVFELKKEWDLKYGENPNQQGAIYFLKSIDGQNARTISEKTSLKSVRSDEHGKGGLSLTNTMDITRAMDALKYFVSVPAVVIMKHNTISSFAKRVNQIQTLVNLFQLAREADLRSNFGGTVVFNRKLGLEDTKVLFELKGQKPFFVDVLATPGYEPGVLEYIQKKSKSIRIGQFSNLDLPKFQGDETHNLISLKEMPTGRIGIQDLYLTSIKGPEDLVLDPLVIEKSGPEHVVNREPSEQELDDMLTAWWLNLAGARSNGIVFVKNGVSVAMGSGQVERVGAVEMAIIKGMQKAMDREGIVYDPLMGIRGYRGLNKNPFAGAACSSDAFFPFRDSIDLAARVGVSAVIQPFGSINDHLVIDAANEHKMSMAATLERCFGHF